MRGSTKWQATVWQRDYKRHTVCVELHYKDDPKWRWSATSWMLDVRDKEGRAKTARAAMRAAEKAIDGMLSRGEE